MQISRKKFQIAALTCAFALVATPSWAVPLDNPLGNQGDAYNPSGGTPSGDPAILFTDIELNYKPGRTKKRTGGGDTGFTGRSTTSSQFAVRAGGIETNFGGSFELNASISPKGTFKGGWFEFTSTDAMFGFGTGEVCNAKGKGCKIEDINGVVFGGDLYSFGWSGTQGFLEFGTTNLYGWAADMYLPNPNITEHIWFNVGAFDLNDATSVHSWQGMGSGIAVVPVPAAAWLFGSGLLGLIGFAKRKRS